MNCIIMNMSAMTKYLQHNTWGSTKYCLVGKRVSMVVMLADTNGSAATADIRSRGSNCSALRLANEQVRWMLFAAVCWPAAGVRQHSSA
jgi:hypothetical protein